MNWKEAEAIMTGVNVGNEMPCCASPAARRYLFESACKATHAVEVGSYIGVSTLALALGCRTTSYDLMDVNADDAYWATDPDLEGCQRMRPSDLAKAAGADATFINIPAPECFIKCEPFDLCFIDGWKDDEVCYQTYVAAWARCPNAKFILHDIYPPWLPELPGACNHRGPWVALERFSLRHEVPYRMIDNLYGSDERMAEFG